MARILEDELKKTLRHFPAAILTGPRGAGKTSLLRHLFPKASYVLVEDPDVIARVRSDPNGFLDDLKPPVILDEIQNVPELFGYIRSRIDLHPRRFGSWLITGSQEASLMKGVAESMAGRAAMFHLLPFSVRETEKVTLFRGGFPEVLDRPAVADTWFRSYIHTYLERDVRAISSIRDLATFRRFLALLASRCGQILNKTDLAGPLGVSVPTISEWLRILEVTGQIILVPPFYENFGKRLVKSPKVYFVDSGLACHLLGIETEKALKASVFLGPIFEGFVASEIIKSQIHAGKAKALYYFRDQQGLEVDFLVPQGDNRLALLEAKASRTPVPDMAKSILRLTKNIRQYAVAGYVVCRPSASKAFRTLCPGVQVVAPDRLADVIGSCPSARRQAG
ncbi:MAG TPA: ATP-binding protein [Candidatus Hydrogenedentes bacterium]|nr:ATP-binding protein [Candidatus Hydrogenedentota bacterium]HOV72803.1 ATP-binding protein [Candidatus Hydrogenedentota bacterium]